MSSFAEAACLEESRGVTVRYALAISILVLSGVLLILGLGQRTFLAGPSEITATATVQSDAHYGIIPAEVFTMYPGEPSVVVKGVDAFAAVGATRDVEAWLAPYSHLEFLAGPQAGTLMSAVIAPEEAVTPEVIPSDAGADATAKPAEGGDQADATAAAETAPDPDAITDNSEPFPQLDPRGSDLWTNSAALTSDDTSPTPANGEVRLPLTITATQSVIVASNGIDPLPKAISIVWQQDRNTPLAGPFLVAGGIFGLLGAILYILAVDHDRRGLGPRRGRKGPLPGIRGAIGHGKSLAKEKAGQGTTAAGSSQSAKPAKEKPEQQVKRVRAVVLPVVLVGALSLAGCSAEYWPDFSPEPPPVVDVAPGAPVPVTEAQVTRILDDVARVSAAGDEELDASRLTSRFTGDALEQRTANYKIRAKVPDYEVLLPTITNEALDYQLVQSTVGWPRAILATVASVIPQPKTDEAKAADQAAETQAAPSLALLLVQQNPHENFMLKRVIALRGSITMPAAAPADEGTALLANDITTQVLTPTEAVTGFAELLQSGGEGENAEFFAIENDPLIAKSGAAWVKLAQERAAAEKQDIDYSVKTAVADSPIVSLSTGMGGALVTATIIETRVEESGDGKWKPTAVGSAAALSGLSGKQDRLVREVAHQLLLFVPAAESGEKIQVLGVTSELVGARK